MEQPRRYPIGIQTFSELVNKHYLYIDKTEYVYRMAHGNSKYLFLSRPRRFGKSLLTSTLHAYFEGRKELFKGLAIEQLETEWASYPVLHFDMSLSKHADRDMLNRYLHSILEDNEKRLGIEPRDTVDVNVRLKNLIMDTCAKTGRQVVVLIDEYDAPLLDVVHEEKDLPVLRNVMRNFYSPLKACDPYLRFVFLTGITKFSQLSIFSELNNIQNISMLPEYAAVCGITQEEMETQMDKDLDVLAPFSLLNAFSEGRLNSYWFGSGTPTYLIEMLKRFDVSPSEIGGRETMAEDFDAPTEHMTDITPLLYQSGYLTIKDYDGFSGLFNLDIPNREIRIGLYRSLLPHYIQGSKIPGNTVIAKMSASIRRGHMEEALQLLQTFLSTLPYAGQPMQEAHYQQLFFVVFSLLGVHVDIEVRTTLGRVDMVMRTADTLYLVELKLNQSAEAAMNQIDLKQYPERFALCGLPVVKVGINFDKEKRTISDWRIEQ